MNNNPPIITFTFFVLYRHPLSRHLLYLQLRRDILEERAHCTSDECMNLAGLALQAEYGDYNKTTCASNYFLPEHYVPPRIVRRLGSAYTKDNLPEAHKSHVGVKDLRAEHEFVKVSMMQAFSVVYIYQDPLS